MLLLLHLQLADRNVEITRCAGFLGVRRQGRLGQGTA